MIKIFKDFKDIDISIIKIRNSGFKLSFVLGLFFTYILYYYSLNPISHLAFDIGYLGVKCSLMLLVSFYVASMAWDKIKKGLI